MASTAASYNPSRDDFAAMLDESFAGGNLQESSVIKGIVVAIEKDMAVIDVGLKTEGRVALREFNGPGRESQLKVGDEVEVFLDRIENALGEAVLSRDKARREESWGKLEKAFNNNEKVHGVQVDGFLSGVFGTLIPVVVKKEWSNYPAVAGAQIGNGNLFVVDITNVERRPLRDRDTKLLTNRQGPGMDRVSAEYLTESSWTVAQEKTHGLLYGIL